MGAVLGAAFSNLPLGAIRGGGGGGGGGGGFVDGGGGAPLPVAAPQPVQAPPQPLPQQTYEVARPIQPETGSVDVVLEDAKLVSEATKLAGPAYSVTFRNQGLAPSGRFLVAAVTSQDGQYDENAPKAVLDVPGLASGESKDVVLRLPRVEFKYLILVVDANGDLTESDKTNNAAVVERGSL